MLLFWEESEELGVDLVDDLLEVLRTVFELDAVHIKDEQVVLVVLDPVFVALVQTGDIVDSDALLILASSLLDLADEVRDRASEVDEKVRRVHKRHHEVEEVRVVLEIPCAHEAHSMKVRREDACVLVDRAVLDDDFVLL